MRPIFQRSLSTSARRCLPRQPWPSLPTFFSASNNQNVTEGPTRIPTRDETASKTTTIRGPSGWAADAAYIILVAGLVYFAADSYWSRIKLQEQIGLIRANHTRTLHNAEVLYMHKIRKEQLKMVEERNRQAKIQTKLLVHISMLRKQLEDNGIDPVSIKKVTEEFEKSVRMEKSPVLDNTLWAVDDSEVRKRMPDIRDYK